MSQVQEPAAPRSGPHLDAVPAASGGMPSGESSSGIMARLLPYLSIARPDHWFKNVFMALGVLLALFHYPQIVSSIAWWHVLLALAATCLLASCNYVLNEILDAPTDRSHPDKRRRPIPSGKVRLPLAYLEWIALGIVGLALAASVNAPFFYSGLFLLIMGLIYNVPPIRSKEHAYIDVLSESINNPIRLLLGWFAVVPGEFPPVSLLIAYWMIGAFFMAAKRFAEFRAIQHTGTAGVYRRSFKHYDERRLIVSMFFYVTSFALFLGIFTIRYRLELILLFPLVAGFICYYLNVAYKQDSAAQHPERLYREKGLMAYLLLCMAAFVALMCIHLPMLYEWFNVTPSQMPTLWRF